MVVIRADIPGKGIEKTIHRYEKVEVKNYNYISMLYQVISGIIISLHIFIQRPVCQNTGVIKNMIKKYNI